jgi:RNA exonuclease 4
MLALDCEMVGVGIDGVESVLARVSVVNQHGALVYDAHVQTVEKVVDYRTKYSGIRPADLKQRAGAKSFKQVQHEVSELIKDRVVIGHGLENDFAALMLSHPWALTRDSARWKPLMRAKRKPHALRFLVRQILGIQIQQGEHDPAEDARAALLLYNHLKKDWERHVKTVLQRTKKKVKKTAPKTTATVSRASSARVNNDDDSDEDDDAGQLDLNLPSDEDEDL